MTIYETYNVDKTKLEYDYEANGGVQWESIPNGGKRVVMPPASDLRYLYITCNMPVKDLMCLLNIGERKVFYLLKEYNLKKETVNRRKNLEAVLEEKYGVTNPKSASKETLRLRFVKDFLASNLIQFETPSKTAFDYGMNFYLPEDHIGLCLHKTTDNENLQKISRQAEDAGVRLIHLWDYEFNQGNIVQKKLELLLKPKEIIYARKTKVKRCSVIEKSAFLKANHIQGNDNAKIGYGLYYNDALVAVMTFCKPRFNGLYEWELSRFCTKEGMKVIGGGSKLLTAFIKEYNPTKIITYSDFTLFAGKTYEKIGFKFLRFSPPNYKWVRGNEVLARYQTMKHKLLEKGFEGNSENEIMKSNGYTKVYDCGNKVWEWCSYGNNYKNEDAERLNEEYGIDSSKLSRDYVSNPVKLPNQRNLECCPPKSDIEHLYLEKNMTLDEMSLYIGLEKSGIVYILKKYGIKKATEAKRNSNITKNNSYATFVLIDKVGNKLYETITYPPVPKGERPDIIVCKDDIYNDYIVNNMSVEEVCAKYKMSKQNLRVVVDDFLKVRKDPIKVKQVTARNLYKKYGVTNVFQKEDIKEKSRKTLQERYGVDSYTKTEEYVHKVRATKLERYGKENYVNINQIVETRRNNYYSLAQLDVISSREKFRKYIQDNKVVNCEHMAKLIGISGVVIRRLANKFDSFDLFDYTKSYQETEVQDFIKDLLPNEALRFNIKILDGKEIDIYIPNRSLGIEYNGSLWHNSANHGTTYHREKTEISNRKGIDLMHIFDYQWLYNFDVVEDIIRHRLGLTETKIGARKCQIKIVDTEVFNEFVETNSLYHAKPVKKHVMGLIYGEELIMGASYIQNGDEVEILEIQGKIGLCVQGGVSRLLKTIERETGVSKFVMKFNFTTFSGNTFKKLGWKFGDALTPRRSWVRYKNFFYEDEMTPTVKTEIGLKPDTPKGKALDYLMGHQYNEVYDCGEILISKG